MDSFFSSSYKPCPLSLKLELKLTPCTVFTKPQQTVAKLHDFCCPQLQRPPHLFFLREGFPLGLLDLGCCSAVSAKFQSALSWAIIWKTITSSRIKSPTQRQLHVYQTLIAFSTCKHMRTSYLICLYLSFFTCKMWINNSLDLWAQ